MKHTIFTTSDHLSHYLLNSSFKYNGELVDIKVSASNNTLMANGYKDEECKVETATAFSFSYEKEKIAALRTILCAIPDQGITLEFSKDQIIIRDIFI